MGTMGVPPSVLYNMPVSVCTSNSGFFLMKNSGFPQPAGSLGLSNSRNLYIQASYRQKHCQPGISAGSQ